MKHLQALYSELDYLTAAQANLNGALSVTNCGHRKRHYENLRLSIDQYVHVLQRVTGKKNDPLPQTNPLPPTKEQGPED